MDFTVEKENFLLDGKPFPLLSGAIHYFRIPEEYWYDRLLKLKECGLNTVETYVCWNAHEQEEGKFDFSGILNIGKFLDTAKELGLYAIVRPGPFICAEWEGGGLPAWLLNIPGMRIRCNNAPYLKCVRNFFEKLFAILVPRLCTNGGNILMLQVENEYGSYGDDKSYLAALEAMYRELGADCLLYHSDGDAATMDGNADTGLYMADNFGSDPVGHSEQMKKLGHSGPFTCGEYWCGWFDHWYEQHHHRDTADVTRELELFLKNNWNLNYYMFCGGTNFGFWNGANYGDKYEPTTTSYDYDALLTEAGDRTEKYYEARRVIGTYYPQNLVKMTAMETKKTAYSEIPVIGTAELFPHLQELADSVKSAATPLSMEEADSYLGYILYETELTAPFGKTITFDQIADRLVVFFDGKRIATLENGKENGNPVLPECEKGTRHSLQILCENMGRVNYGPKTLDSKGLHSVRIDAAYHFGWKTSCLPMRNLSRLQFEKPHKTEMPAFHKAVLTIQGDAADTYLSVRGFHKGFILVNGRNIGRFYTDAGPQMNLYIPAPFLNKGDNEILLFESERTECLNITFQDHPEFN